MNEKSIIEKLGITPNWKASVRDEPGNHVFMLSGNNPEVKNSCHVILMATEEHRCPKKESDISCMTSAPEMLEALIEDCIEDEEFYIRKGYNCFDVFESKGQDGINEYKSFYRKIKIIEKATGKTWEQIKELL